MVAEKRRARRRPRRWSRKASTFKRRRHAPEYRSLAQVLKVGSLARKAPGDLAPVRGAGARHGRKARWPRTDRWSEETSRSQGLHGASRVVTRESKQLYLQAFDALNAIMVGKPLQSGGRANSHGGSARCDCCGYPGGAMARHDCQVSRAVAELGALFDFTPFCDREA